MVWQAEAMRKAASSCNDFKRVRRDATADAPILTPRTRCGCSTPTRTGWPS